MKKTAIYCVVLIFCVALTLIIAKKYSIRQTSKVEFPRAQTNIKVSRISDADTARVQSELIPKNVNDTSAAERTVDFDRFKILFEYIGVQEGILTERDRWERAIDDASKGIIFLEPMLFDENDDELFEYKNSKFLVILRCDYDKKRYSGRVWNIGENAKETCSFIIECDDGFDAAVLTKAIISSYGRFWH